MYLLQFKAPPESKGKWDVLEIAGTISARQGFSPNSQRRFSFRPSRFRYLADFLLKLRDARFGSSTGNYVLFSIELFLVPLTSISKLKYRFIGAFFCKARCVRARERGREGSSTTNLNGYIIL